MRGTSQKIHIVAFQTFVMLMQRKDFTIFLHQSQRQAGNVYFRINICLAFGEDAVFQPHVVQYAGKRLYVGHFNLYTFPAGGFEIPGADFFYHMPSVDKTVMSGKPGKLI